MVCFFFWYFFFGGGGCVCCLVSVFLFFVFCFLFFVFCCFCGFLIASFVLLVVSNWTLFASSGTQRRAILLEQDFNVTLKSPFPNLPMSYSNVDTFIITTGPRSFNCKYNLALFFDSPYEKNRFFSLFWVFLGFFRFFFVLYIYNKD